MLFLQKIAEEFCGKSMTASEAGEGQRQIIIIKADVDECGDIAEAFGVQVLPSFMVIEQKINISETGQQIMNGVIRSTHIGQQVLRIKDDFTEWLSNGDIAESGSPKPLPAI
jgi:hypothetical protein